MNAPAYRKITLNDVAYHEAAHMVIYLLAGGSTCIIRAVEVKKTCGSFYTPYIFPHPYDNLAEACVRIAGVVINELIEISPDGASYDLKVAKELLSADKLLSEANILVLKAKVERLLWKYIDVVSVVAQHLIKQRNKQGVICERKCKAIAQDALEHITLIRWLSYMRTETATKGISNLQI
ncbi:MAG: hypothetical protein HOP26_07365 [Methylotenera sp.]|nr:hypothetical protein [Methylotenera sp.]